MDNVEDVELALDDAEDVRLGLDDVEDLHGGDSLDKDVHKIPVDMDDLVDKGLGDDHIQAEALGG